jgi:hypothetical protein
MRVFANNAKNAQNKNTHAPQDLFSIASKYGTNPGYRAGINSDGMAGFLLRTRPRIGLARVRGMAVIELWRPSVE